MGSEETRSRILNAAVSEFAEKGYAGATTRGIAARAGVNEVTLFRHFGTKGELLKAVMASAPLGGALTSELFAALKELPAREGLLQLGHQWLEILEQLMIWLRLHLVEQGGLAKEAKERKAHHFGFRERLAEYLRLKQTAGELRPDIDPAQAAETFAFGILGVCRGPPGAFPRRIQFVSGGIPAIPRQPVPDRHGGEVNDSSVLARRPGPERPGESRREGRQSGGDAPGGAARAPGVRGDDRSLPGPPGLRGPAGSHRGSVGDPPGG